MSLKDTLGFSTEYPIDKIVDELNGSFSVAANVTTPVNDTVAHGLDYTPLIEMMWSIDNFNFRPHNLRLIQSIDPYKETVVIAKADDTNITFNSYNDNSASVTIYYKVFLIHPDTTL